MKNLNCLIFLALLLSSCSTYNFSHRSVSIDKNNLIATPVVVDLNVVDGKKIIATSDKKKSAEIAKDQAYYKAIVENGIDVVIDPVYKLTYKPTFLFFRKRYTAEVSGLAGKYDNSRNIYEAVKPYSLDSNAIKSFRKLNGISEKDSATNEKSVIPGLKINPNLNLNASTSTLLKTLKVLNFGPAAAIISVPKSKSPASSTRFGVTTGFTSARMKFESSSNVNIDPKIGFTAGMYLNVALRKRTEFQSGLLYSQRGAILNFLDFGLSEKFTYTLNYLEIPLNLLFYRNPKRSGLFLGGGPLIGIGLSGKIKSSTEEFDIDFGGQDLKTLDLGFNFIAGIRSKKGRSIAINYLAGSNVGIAQSVSNRYIGVRFGYEFPTRK
jgi:hypothetical protein